MFGADPIIPGSEPGSEMTFRLRLPPRRRREVDRGDPSWASVLLGLSVLNLLVFFWLSVVMGGTAIGTRPVDGVFPLVEHADVTLVSRELWLFNLVYSWLSVTLPFFSVWAVLWKGEYASARFSGEEQRVAFQVLGLFGVFWVMLISYQAVSSWVSYLRG